MRRILARTVIFLLIVAGAAAAAYQWGRQAFERPGPAREEIVVMLPQGIGLDELAQRLAKAGVVDRWWVFALGVRTSGKARALRAGEYAFAPGISAEGVMAVLLGGRTVQHRLTIPEGLTNRQTLAIIASAATLVGETGEVSGEGTLMPETYYFSRDDKRSEIADRMRRAMDTALAELWADRAAGLPLASPDEARVLASIVEKETALADERRHVAGVFINRLNRGMRLQSDATVIYAIAGPDGTMDRPLTRADLDVDSAYNTYRVTGLPPTPIANPGRAALTAVLDPLPTKDIYFVADGAGGHAFAATLAEHNRNVAKWRKIQRARKQQTE